MSLHGLGVLARPYRAAMLVAGSLVAVESAVALSIPWLAMRATDMATATDARGISFQVLLLLGLGFAIQMSLRILNGWLSGRLALRIGTDMRIHVFDHVQDLPLPSIQRHGHGDLVALLTRETEVLAQFVGVGIPALFVASLTAVGTVVLMSIIDPLFTLFLLLLLPVSLVSLRVMGKGMRRLALDVQQDYARLLAMLGESLSVMPLLKAFARERWASVRHEQQSRRYRVASERQLLVTSTLQPVLQFTMALAVLVLIAIAAGRLVAREVSPGELVGFILYMVLLMRPLGTLGSLYGQWQAAQGALQRLRDVLATPGEHNEGGQVLPTCRGALSFEGLVFAYDGISPVLNRLNLDIHAGEIVVIVGENGAGKSTLLSLLLRFRTPDQGRILLDGVDIATLELQYLRRSIALVSQPPQFIDASIRENLLFGNESATPAELEAVARLAGVHAFASAMPQGYETRIGEQGQRLSGGQRQRLALARALLKPAPVLVLDEATAMLDPAAEQEILAGCRKALAGKTVIMVTHHPASLAIADRVLELRDGVIYATGGLHTHVARQVVRF